MLSFDVMQVWTCKFDLLRNRIGVVNQLLGCRYHNGNDARMCMTRVSGGYDVCFDSDVISSFRLWDIDSLTMTFEKVDAWADCLWRCLPAA